MTQWFTVVPDGTRLFRTKLEKFSAELDNPTANMSEPMIFGNFDCFRTFKSPRATSIASPKFPDWEETFNYETLFADRMAFKRLVLEIRVKEAVTQESEHYFGEAEVDLLTLATGPQKITLTVYDGEVPNGMIAFFCMFEEISEVRVDMPKLVVQMPHSLCTDVNAVFVEIVTRETDNTIETGAPDSIGTAGRSAAGDLVVAKFGMNIPFHYFGCNLTEFLENRGFRFAVKQNGVISDTLLGTADLLFSAFMHGEDDQPDSNIEFELDLLDKDNKSVGHVSGECDFRSLPKFIQMYAGHTVDGMVFDGKARSGHHPQPPNVAGPDQQRPAFLDRA